MTEDALRRLLDPSSPATRLIWTRLLKEVDLSFHVVAREELERGDRCALVGDEAAVVKAAADTPQLFVASGRHAPGDLIRLRVWPDGMIGEY